MDNSPIGILEEMEYQPILEMAHVDRPGLASWGLSGRDVVITGSGTFPALAHDGYDSIYLSGSGPVAYNVHRCWVSQKITTVPSI